MPHSSSSLPNERDGLPHCADHVVATEQNDVEQCTRTEGPTTTTTRSISDIAPASPSLPISSGSLGKCDEVQGVLRQIRRLGATKPFFLPSQKLNPVAAGPVSIEFKVFTPAVNNSFTRDPGSVRSGTGLAGSVNILREICQSVQRQDLKRQTVPSWRSPTTFATIFEDSEDENQRQNRVNSSLPDEQVAGGVSNSSLSEMATTTTVHTLREISGNAMSARSHLSHRNAYVHGTRTSRGDEESAMQDLSQHIEYLEHELALANAKNEQEDSQIAKKRRNIRLKALVMENSNLQQEMSSWQQKYEESMEGLRSLRQNFETDLEHRMAILAAESEMKDARISELEWELECMNIKVRRATGLEDANRDLERRLEVFSKLLVQVPSDMTAPAAKGFRKYSHSVRNPSRPGIPLAAATSSPGGVCLSSHTTENMFWQPRRFDTVSGTPEASQLKQEQSMSPESIDASQSPASSNEAGSAPENGALASVSQASVSFRSAASSTSRPTSCVSNSSTSLSSWTAPLPQEEKFDPATVHKKRRMRRFAPGSKSLKPLVLPTTTNLNASASNAIPIYGATETTPESNQSDASLDPTTAFLTKTQSDARNSTPTRLRKTQSVIKARLQALEVLEGRRKTTMTCQSDSPEPRSFFEDYETATPPSLAHSTCSSIVRTRPKSLQDELDEADNIRTGVETVVDGNYSHIEDGLMPVTRQPTPEATMPAPMPDSRFSTTSSHFFDQYSHDVFCDSESYIGGRHSIAYSERPLPHQRLRSSSCSRAEHARGVIARLTNMILKAQDDPVVLAKHLMAKAWTTGPVNMLGGVGWWLFGPVYHHKRKSRQSEYLGNLAGLNRDQRESYVYRRRRMTQGEMSVDGDVVAASSFDWQPYSTEASKHNTMEYQMRDQNRQSGTWLLPHYLQNPMVPSANTRNSADDYANDYSNSHEVQQPYVVPTTANEEEKPPRRHKIGLWLQFSLTLFLAVGMAVRFGPGALLADMPSASMRWQCDAPLRSSDDPDGIDSDSKLTKSRRPPSKPPHHRHTKHFSRIDPIAEEQHPSPPGEVQRQDRDFSDHSHKTDHSFADSGYAGSIVFAETLGPEDFEKGTLIMDDESESVGDEMETRESIMPGMAY